ncbi:GPR137B [Bugula neritina]|uniref:GPR137B n=1 Tax=Bugula neritina TaxID=10212 RepID=A0A7J7KA87_BUGNE|nr:GPR137B [Bugula neritina]
MNISELNSYTDSPLKEGDQVRLTANTMPTLRPSLSYATQLGLTITCIVIFSLLFLFVYVQLWMILYYKHKKRSYQTVFLLLCLIWAALRVTLFSFYFTDVIIANNLDPFSNWLLYSLPVVLQFTTLVLLVAFFSQVVIKAKYPQSARIYKNRVRVLCTLSVFVFTTVNAVCGVIAQMYKSDSCPTAINVLFARVAINGSLFVVHGIALSYWIFTLNKVANARTLLESRGTNLCQSWTTCVFIVFIYASRAVYNALCLILLSLDQQQQLPDFGYGWINVTDQADLVDLSQQYYYPVYLIILFIWEILPTLVVTIFFRVQKPSSVMEVNADNISYRQQYFFDNPRRYDSEEDLSARYASNSFSGISRHAYGSINNGQQADHPPLHYVGGPEKGRWGCMGNE